MPYHDGTGPLGDGRPGRGLGPCGRFRNFFFGGGRGYRSDYPLRRRRRFIDYIFPSKYEDPYTEYPYEESELKAMKQDLEKELKRIDEKLKEPKKEK